MQRLIGDLQQQLTIQRHCRRHCVEEVSFDLNCLWGLVELDFSHDLLMDPKCLACILEMYLPFGHPELRDEAKFIFCLTSTTPAGSQLKTLLA